MEIPLRQVLLSSSSSLAQLFTMQIHSATLSSFWSPLTSLPRFCNRRKDKDNPSPVEGGRGKAKMAMTELSLEGGLREESVDIHLSTFLLLPHNTITGGKGK